MEKFLLFVQHGWADNHYGMLRCARLLGVNPTDTIAPNLGWWRTWWRMAPLIEQVRRSAETQLLHYPDRPWRIVGHSMGGLIWLELLHRFPQWRDRVESLVLLGSPVGGAELGRILDPLSLGLGVARDLGINRRPIAEIVAAQIPTLSIAGDLDGGSDGVVTIGATQFNYCQWQSFPDIFHPDLRFDARVIRAIQEFWHHAIVTPLDRNLQQQLIDYLRSVPGIIDGHWRNFRRSKVVYQFEQGLTLKQWYDPLGICHIYVGNQLDHCIYAGYTGWLHQKELKRSIEGIADKFRRYIKVDKYQNNSNSNNS